MKRKAADLWRTCLHEAAHVIVAKALNRWNTSASARVDIQASGAGTAIFPHGMTPTAEAVATAAGQYGGKLIRVFPKPRRRRVHLPPPDTIPGKRARAVREILSEAAHNLQHKALQSGTDNQDVARFCISFDPADPKDWTRRFRRIHAQARLMVWRRRNEIREAATVLFHEGEITLPGKPEDDEFFNCSHNADGKEENKEGETK